MNAIAMNEQDLHQYFGSVILGSALLLSVLWCTHLVPVADILSGPTKYSVLAAGTTPLPGSIGALGASKDLIGFQYTQAGQVEILH
jgi:hypothetical protein